MSKVTYICLYNNQVQLDALLLPSIELLHKEGRSCDLILVDCKERGYHSAAEAFNKTLDENWDALADIVCFVHQDIKFDTLNFHDRLCEELSLNPFQLLGAAGMTNKGHVLSNLRYWNTKQYIVGHQIIDKVEVESLDECCFGTSKELLSKVRFDERCCFHWHLYAVDLCYEAKRKFDYHSYVIPDMIYHKFDGDQGLTTDIHFLNTMWNLTRKYRKDFIRLYAPCYIVNTHPFWAILKLTRTYLHRCIE